jgi:hypothetical protein
MTPLYLSVPNIFLNGNLPASSGTISTEFCAVGTNGTNCGGVSTVPLPTAFLLFASALAGVGGFGWLKRRGKVSKQGDCA